MSQIKAVPSIQRGLDEAKGLETGHAERRGRRGGDSMCKGMRDGVYLVAWPWVREVTRGWNTRVGSDGEGLPTC